jgi:hypothetical protein
LQLLFCPPISGCHVTIPYPSFRDFLHPPPFTLMGSAQIRSSRTFRQKEIPSSSSMAATRATESCNSIAVAGRPRGGNLMEASPISPDDRAFSIPISSPEVGRFPAMD